MCSGIVLNLSIGWRKIEWNIHTLCQYSPKDGLRALVQKLTVRIIVKCSGARIAATRDYVTFGYFAADHRAKFYGDHPMQGNPSVGA